MNRSLWRKTSNLSYILVSRAIELIPASQPERADEAGVALGRAAISGLLADMHLGDHRSNNPGGLAYLRVNNASAVNTNGFTIVSRGADSSGNLYYGSYNAAESANQTFVVELAAVSICKPGAEAPEPGFYASCRWV